MASFAGALEGAGKGLEAIQTNMLQQADSDRKDKMLALETPFMQAQGQEAQALSQQAQMDLAERKKKAKLREETVPMEDILKANPMMPYLAKYVDQSGINMSKTMPKKGDIADYAQWLHTDQGIPFFQKAVEEFRNDNVQKSKNIDAAVTQKQQQIQEFLEKHPGVDKNELLDGGDKYKEMMGDLQSTSNKKKEFVSNRAMAEAAQKQIDKQLELKNKGTKESSEDQWLLLDQKERTGQVLTPAEKAQKDSINAYLNKTKVELPGAAQAAKDKADEAEYRKNLPSTMSLLAQGKITAGMSNWKPLLNAVFNDELYKWNKTHPDQQINPNLIKAVQEGNKAAMQRMTTLAAAASTSAQTVEKQIREQLTGIVDGLTSTDLTWVNKKLRGLAAGTGSVNAAAFFNVLTEIKPEYARVMQGTSASSVAPTDAANEMAERLLPEGATIPQLKNNMRLMQQSMRFRMGSYNETNKSLQDAIAYGTGYQAAGATPSSGGGENKPLEKTPW